MVIDNFRSVKWIVLECSKFVRLSEKFLTHGNGVTGIYQ